MSKIIKWTITETNQSNIYTINKPILHMGQTAIFELSGTPTTGYGWYLRSPTKKLSVTYDFKSSSKNVGAPTVYYIYVTRLEQGSELLHLVYKRQWEKNKKPINEIVGNIY
jgi:predicted secreted protein